MKERDRLEAVPRNWLHPWNRKISSINKAATRFERRFGHADRPAANWMFLERVISCDSFYGYIKCCNKCNSELQPVYFIDF